MIRQSEGGYSDYLIHSRELEKTGIRISSVSKDTDKSDLGAKGREKTEIFLKEQRGIETIDDL